ncbi:glutathione peroxidase [Candidatus Poseidoniaceae archaeon]|jgi:glutathione peroxidase|nr:glutathione peroxidase [Candidatus Poseidoniaceae archaeon]|tara:strand:+ start:979 stop:1434 length:456 start_codon:yes stop_codon:yes gene_type:complete
MDNPLDAEIEDMNGKITTLREIGGGDTNTWVVVNVASACGFTRQYSGLQQLSVKDGVTVVGFPCNQFGGQEPGTHEEICEFTESKFGVDFPLMAKVDVKGENTAPLFENLSRVMDAGGYEGEIRWNFEKFVINRDGEVARFSSRDEPEDLL